MTQHPGLPSGFILFGDLPKLRPYLLELHARDMAILVITGPATSSLERRAAGFLSASNHPFELIESVRRLPGDDLVGILDQVMTWRARHHIVGAFAAAEPFVEAAGVVTDLLDLPGVSLRASRVCRNKLLQRQYLSAWSPPSRMVTAGTIDTVSEVWAGPFPVVVKPLTLWSSIGVQKFDDPQALAAHLQDLDPELRVLLEQFVSGREFNVDALVVDGEPYFSAITQKGTNEAATPFFAELIHTLPPTNLSQIESERVHRTHADVISSLDFGTGMAHAEYRVKDDGGVVLVEIAARPPGDGCLALYHLATGQPIESALIEASLGRPASYAEIRRRARQIYLEHEPGRLQSVTVDWPGLSEPAWLSEVGVWPVPQPGKPDDPPTLREVMVLKERGEALVPITQSSARAVTGIFDAPLSSNLDEIDARVRCAIHVEVDSKADEEEMSIQMPRSAESVLSAIDGNGRPVPDDVLGRAYAKLLHINGYVQLINVPDTFDYVGFLATFGDFLPDPAGMVVGDLVPDRTTDNVYHSGNTRALVPHTEGYDLDGLPPRYLALWCITPAAGEGGETTLFDGYRVLATMSSAAREHFEHQRYRWTIAAGLREQGMSYEATHPVLETVDGVELLRFSYNNVARPHGDEYIEEFLEHGKRQFDDHHVRIRYESNDLLQWDNWRMLHARNAFEDPRRHLKRVLIRHQELESLRMPADRSSPLIAP